MRGQRIDVEQLLRQSQTELLWIQRQLSIIAAGDANHAQAQKKVSNPVKFTLAQSDPLWFLITQYF